MTNLDIQNSRHLLKRLDEEMIFLSSLMTQINNISFQVIHVSSNINGIVRTATIMKNSKTKIFESN